MTLQTKVIISQDELPLWQELLRISGRRHETLLAFCALHGLTTSAVGRAIDLHQTNVSGIFRGVLAPRHRINQIKKLGIPGFLLPEPSRGRARSVARDY
ncbi:MAG: hypothetical protein KKE73_08220 [Proteobacteria bacterium]|nr:hypothetical protein [Pseudomonadota bacterium]